MTAIIVVVERCCRTLCPIAKSRKMMTVERTAEHNVGQFPQVQQICNEAQLWPVIGTKTKRPDRCRSGRPWTILFVSPFGVSPSAHLTGPLKRERRDGDIPEPRPAMMPVFRCRSYASRAFLSRVNSRPLSFVASSVLIEQQGGFAGIVACIATRISAGVPLASACAAP